MTTDATSATGDVSVGVTYTTSTAADIKPQWLNVARRLQSACYGNQGYAVLSMRVLVDGTGSPVCWTEPDRVKVEPKSLNEALLSMTL